MNKTLYLATQVKTRDGAFVKDAAVTNGYIEVKPEGPVVYKRPGTFAPLVNLNAALRGARRWEGKLYVAAGGFMNRIGSAVEASFAIAGTEPVSITNTGVATVGYLVFKDTAHMWVLTGSPGTLTQVTDAQYPAVTVPGIALLDGTFYVMDPKGQIFGSELEDPTNWTALNAIVAEVESDAGVAIGKHMNYVVAFKERTIELFYDAANANGSPLDRVTSAAIKIGCINGYSLAEVDGALIFLSRTSSKQASVHMFPTGSQTPVEIATEDVQRVLADLNFTSVYAWAGRIDGHAFYVLDLKSDGITLVYDLTSKVWSRWTKLTARTASNVTIFNDTGLAIVLDVGHGISDGDPVTIAGAAQSDYNGLKNVTVIDADRYSFPVPVPTATPATGTITAVKYTEGRFPAGAFVDYNGKNYVVDDSLGVVSEIGSTATTDNGIPIDCRIRTPKFDAGDGTKFKTLDMLTFIGDAVDSDVLIRYSDDDYRTFSKYRRVNLSGNRPNTNRLGKFYRRAFELRHTGPTRFRISSLNVELR